MTALAWWVVISVCIGSMVAVLQEEDATMSPVHTRAIFFSVLIFLAPIWLPIAAIGRIVEEW